MQKLRTKEIRPQRGMQERFVRSDVDVCFAGGVLNPQPLTSLILTPSGYKPLSEVGLGERVCGIDGSLQTIIHYDKRGEKECIRIYLEDGSYAECALDHKWWCMKQGVELTAIGFELLEHYAGLKKGEKSELFFFKIADFSPLSASDNYFSPLFRSCCSRQSDSLGDDEAKHSSLATQDPSDISNKNRQTMPSIQAVRLERVVEIGRREVVCIGVSNEDQLYITDCGMITKNCGKAQPLSSLVLTPIGFVRMGDLCVGDSICDTEGGVQTVERIYEKGERDVFKISFDFGEARCCAEHLWKVYDLGSRREKLLKTEELLMSNYRRMAVVCPAPVYQATREDDSSQLRQFYIHGRRLARGRSDTLSKKAHRLLYRSTSLREEMIRGFMDECGAQHHSNRFTRRWMKPQDAALLSLLAASLGGTLTLLKSDSTHKRVQVLLCLPARDKDGHILSAALLSRDQRPYRVIRNITYDGREPCRCIQVSHPNHLYITDFYIPTHNTFAAVLMVAEPSLDPRFRGVFTRRNLGNIKAGGGIIDEFTEAYGDYVDIKISDSPRVQFPSGAYVDCIHIADEHPAKLMERLKGLQFDLAYMDELTSYEFTTFSILGTRVRGRAKWSGKLRGTTNPKRNHWTRKILDWYIGPDGFIIPERDGVVRYYFQMGETVDTIVMGSSKEAVYNLCKLQIDQQLERLGSSDWSYEDLIRSFVFYSGKMSENRASIGGNTSYAGAVSAVGGRRAQQLIEGNFNVDEDEDDTAAIKAEDAMAVLHNDACTNGDLWITADLADVGSDNLVVLLWDGLHVVDMMVVCESTPRLNAERIRYLASVHGVSETHIIYDATNGRYMYDYLPHAVPFVSASSAIGIQSLLASRLKDECYLRLCDVIRRRGLSISEKVSSARYHHKSLRQDYSVQMEFLDECSVVRFREQIGGRLRLMTKKEMNALLGKNRSMDLLDPIAMRMYPLLSTQFGEELSSTALNSSSTSTPGLGLFNIYDEGSWC